MKNTRSSAFGSGPPASSRRRFCTHLLAVLEFRPSSAQHSVIGLPVEMIQSAVSRLNSSACLAAGLVMASVLSVVDECILKDLGL